MVREAHAATKDLRAAVREAKRELNDLAKNEVAAQIQAEVSRQLEDLGERTSAAIKHVATQKVIAEFDRFGESLLGKETYWANGPAAGEQAQPAPTQMWCHSTSRPTARTGNADGPGGGSAGAVVIVF